MLQQMWSWVVVGTLVLFLLATAITFMTTSHPWIADIFFLLSSGLFSAKFLTWEEVQSKEETRRAFIIQSAFILIVIVLFVAIGSNHYLNRIIPTTYGGPSYSPRSEPSNHPGPNGPVNMLAGTSASIRVIADMACEVSIDGKVVGKIAAEKSVVRQVEFGEHRIAATVSGSPIRWEETRYVEKAGQVVVETALQEELLKYIAGSWSWDNDHDTEGLRPNHVDNRWQVFVSPNEKSLTNAHVELTRTVGYYFASDTSDICTQPECYKCTWSYELILPKPYSLSSLAFKATRELKKKSFAIRGDMESICREKVPNVEFSGSLVPLAQSRLQLHLDKPALDKPAVDEILARQ